MSAAFSMMMTEFAAAGKISAGTGVIADGGPVLLWNQRAGLTYRPHQLHVPNRKSKVSTENSGFTGAETQIKSKY